MATANFKAIDLARMHFMMSSYQQQLRFIFD